MQMTSQNGVQKRDLQTKYRLGIILNNTRSNVSEAHLIDGQKYGRILWIEILERRR